MTYSVSKEKRTITCVTSHGFPEPSVTVYYRDREIAKSRNNITMGIAQSGLYACKITNYISSDQRQLFIPELSTLSALPTGIVMTESAVNQTNPNIEALKTEDNTTRLETTSPSRRRHKDTEESVGTGKFTRLLAAKEISSIKIFTNIALMLNSVKSCFDQITILTRFGCYTKVCFTLHVVARFISLKEFSRKTCFHLTHRLNVKYFSHFEKALCTACS